jgi:hypothetical protein
MQVREEEAQGDRRCCHAESSHQGIVVGTKTSKYIGDELAIGEGMTGSDKVICKSLHLGEELQGIHLQLLGVGKGNEEVVDFSFALGGEHLFKGAPDSDGVQSGEHVA